MRILILDTETSGLDPETGHLLEVATAVYSADHLSVTRVRSWLVQAPSNEAEAINGIPAALVADSDCASDRCYSDKWVQGWASDCDAIVAYRSDFDRQWFHAAAVTTPWVEAMDFAWPRGSTSKSLVAVALAHGIGIGSAHRALDDVLILARLLTRAAELGMNIEEQVRRGLRPRGRFVVTETTYNPERNAMAKEAGFRWEADLKVWARSMAIADTAALPFAVKQVA